VRLVRVKAPQGRGRDVAQIAFAAGISRVAIHQHQILTKDEREEITDVIDVETATPTAKAFTDALMQTAFFDPKDYSITVRQPRSVVSRERPANLTVPLVEPTLDIFEELWQFSHVTFGFIGRIFIASLFLAYGIIEAKILLIIAGLLFLPVLPPILAIGFGIWTKEWRLAVQGLFALLVASLLGALAGILTALVTSPPIKFNESNRLLVSFLISFGVGTAAGLATADDVGRREMIGLAATAQIAILPVWFGVCFIFGFPNSAIERGVTFVVNVFTIILASFATYAFLKMQGGALRRFTDGR
jgi:Domain of unknown function (DUF389)